MHYIQLQVLNEQTKILFHTRSILVPEETRQIQGGKSPSRTINHLDHDATSTSLLLLEAVNKGAVNFLSSFESSLSICAWLRTSEARPWCLPCSITEALSL